MSSYGIAIGVDGAPPAKVAGPRDLIPAGYWSNGAPVTTATHARARRAVGSQDVGADSVPASAVGFVVIALRSPMNPDLGSIAFNVTGPFVAIASGTRRGSTSSNNIAPRSRDRATTCAAPGSCVRAQSAPPRRL